MFRVAGAGGSHRSDQGGVPGNAELAAARSNQRPMPQTPDAMGFDGLRALRRRQPIAPEMAATFGLNAGSAGDEQAGTPARKTSALWFQAPVIRSSLGILAPKLTDELPKEARRALVVGRTVESIDGSPTEKDERTSRKSKRSTWFVEVPSRPTVKWLTSVQTRRFHSDDPEALRAKRGISMQPAPDGAAGREPPAVAGMAGRHPFSREVRLDDEVAATFGTDATVPNIPGAVAIGQETKSRFQLDLLPGLPFRKMHVGVTTRVADFPPSPEYPNGMTEVQRMRFSQVPERQGKKVMLFQRKRSGEPQ